VSRTINWIVRSGALLVKRDDGVGTLVFEPSEDEELGFAGAS
jgi:hypothetical protein